MKREFKGFLACVAVVVLMGAARRYTDVTVTSLNEGNAPVPFSTALSDSAWTAIGSSSPAKRRALGIQSPSTNTGFVCISTTSTSGVTCTVDTNGYQLEPGAAITINDEAVWYGRINSGSVTTVKGSEHADNRD